jgi:ABC-type branched-subunit amino acid transport system substrate-binding protein
MTRSLPTLACFTFALCSSACSFVVDDSPYACGAGKSCEAPSQCDKDADCAKLSGKPFCFEQRCYACKPHQLCSNTDQLCVADGDSAACKPLLNPDTAPECTGTLPEDRSALAGKDLFVAGMMLEYPINSNNKTYGVAPKQGITLAVQEINDVGIPAPKGDGPDHELLVVMCSEAGDNTGEAVRRIATHLSGPNSLRTPVILGGSTSGKTRYLIDGSGPLGKQDTLVLSPTATADNLTALAREGQQLFWRTVAPDKLQSAALAKVVPVVSDAIRKANPDVGTPLLAIPYKDDDAGRGLEAEVVRQLRGQTPATMSYSANDDERKQDVSAVVKWLVSGKFSIIMPLGTEEFVNEMMISTEQMWKGAQRPWYVMPEGSRGGDYTAVAMSGAMNLSSRIIGTAPGSRTAGDYKTFAAKFEEFYRRRTLLEDQGERAQPGNLAECGYDAVYLLTYALLKTGKAWPSGGELATAIDALSCKDPAPTRIDPDMFETRRISVVSRPDDCFDYFGANGELDYEPLQEDGRDATTDNDQMVLRKEITSDTAYWCLRADESTPNIVNYYPAEGGDIAGNPPLSFDSAMWCEKSVQ